MSLGFIPKTTLGRRSSGIVIAVPLLMFAGMSFVDYYESVPAGKTMLHGELTEKWGNPPWWS